MFSVAFWKAAAERAAKTGAQACLLAWGLGEEIAEKVNIEWGDVPGVFAGGAVVSLAFSVASIPLSRGNSPSLVPEAEIASAQQG
jgi:hypothetical protein